MKTSKIFLMFLTFILALSTANAYSEEKPARSIALIVSRRWENVESITLPTLRSIFLKQLPSFAQTQPKPIHRRIDSPIRAAFNRQVLRMNESELKAYWLKKNLAGQETPPKSFDTPKAVILYVKRNPGAIGYVEAEELKEMELQDIKVIPLVDENGDACKQCIPLPLDY